MWNIYHVIRCNHLLSSNVIVSSKTFYNSLKHCLRTLAVWGKWKTLQSLVVVSKLNKEALEKYHLPKKDDLIVWPVSGSVCRRGSNLCLDRAYCVLSQRKNTGMNWIRLHWWPRRTTGCCLGAARVHRVASSYCVCVCVKVQEGSRRHNKSIKLKQMKIYTNRILDSADDLILKSLISFGFS